MKGSRASLAITKQSIKRNTKEDKNFHSDDGETWGGDIILRDDGGNHDIGYPRTVQRVDGKMVTVYYFNDHPDGERYIAATIWEP